MNTKGMCIIYRGQELPAEGGDIDYRGDSVINMDLNCPKKNSKDRKAL